jgi:hypothetical protein
VLIPLTKLFGHLSQEEEDLLVVVATARPNAQQLLALLRSNRQQDLHVYQIWWGRRGEGGGDLRFSPLSLVLLSGGARPPVGMPNKSVSFRPMEFICDK